MEVWEGGHVLVVLSVLTSSGRDTSVAVSDPLVGMEGGGGYG